MGWLVLVSACLLLSVPAEAAGKCGLLQKRVSRSWFSAVTPNNDGTSSSVTPTTLTTSATTSATTTPATSSTTTPATSSSVYITPVTTTPVPSSTTSSSSSATATSSPETFTDDNSSTAAPSPTASTPAQSQLASTNGAFVWPQPNQSNGPGKLPINIAQVEELGKALQPNIIVQRDLGFSGVLNGQSIYAWGDSMWYNSAGAMSGLVSASASYGSFSDPMSTFDFVNSDGGLDPWIETNATEDANGGAAVYAFWPTQVVEPIPGSGNGLVFHDVVYRPDNKITLLCTGVAAVTAPVNSPSYTNRSNIYFTPEGPVYGTAFVVVYDGHVYAFGHGDNSTTYLTRAPASTALTDQSSYEYWDGTTFGPTIKMDSASQVFGPYVVSAGSAFWSNYYNCFMFVYSNGYGDGKIMARTASVPQGPYSDEVLLYEDTTPSVLKYAAAGHPEYDSTGQTLLISYTRNVSYTYNLRVHFQ